jgi:hypothetical protein
VIYPNIYVVLVAPPGVGKTEMTWRARDMWKALGDHHIAPSSVTKASLIDALDGAKRHVVRPNENPASILFNSLIIASDELGVLLPGYDSEFMNTLTTLYDCKHYSETRRSREVNINLKNPQLNILAACTPSYLTALMPEGAWDQGFASRVFLIYNGERVVRSLFSVVEENEEKEKRLKETLKEIGTFYGKMSFTQEAAEHIDHWHMNDGEPTPDHPKLFHYCTRRTVHALKLSMVASLSESREGVIQKDHVMRAIDWMIEAEHFMPDIFKAGGASSHSQLIEEIWYFIYKAYMKANKTPVNEGRVINYVQQRTPAHNVERVLHVMEKSGIIARTMGKTGIGYVPKGKE